MPHQTTIKLAFLSALLAASGACTKEVAGPSKVASAETTNPRTVKTGAGLDFAARMQTPLAAGSPHSVTLVISHAYAGQNLTLTADANPEVQLGAKSTVIALAKGKDATWTIPFTATKDGLYYINIIGKVAGSDGTAEARAYAVRLEVGEQIKSLKPTPKEIILPAEEKISG